jgi:hypothetical protein
MLMNLHKKSWTYGLKLQRFEDHHKANETTIEVIIRNMGGGRRGRGRERHISIALLLRWVCGTPFEGHQVLLLISRIISPSFLSSQSITFSSLLFQAMLKLSKDYNERVQEEEGKTAEELIVANVGKIDPKRHLESDVAVLMASNIVQCLGAMLDTIVF